MDVGKQYQEVDNLNLVSNYLKIMDAMLVLSCCILIECKEQVGQAVSNTVGILVYMAWGQLIHYYLCQSYMSQHHILVDRSQF